VELWLRQAVAIRTGKLKAEERTLREPAPDFDVKPTGTLLRNI